MPQRGENYTMSNGKIWVLDDTRKFPYSATWDGSAVGYICPHCITRDEEYTCFGETKIHWHDCPKHRHMYDTECHLGITWAERVDDLRKTILGYRVHKEDCTPETRHLWPDVTETYVHGDGCSYSAEPATKMALQEDVNKQDQEIMAMLDNLKVMHAGKHFVPDSLAYEIDRLEKELNTDWAVKAVYTKRCDGRYVNKFGDMFTSEMNRAYLWKFGVDEQDHDFEFNNYFMDNTKGRVEGEPACQTTPREGISRAESLACPSSQHNQKIHGEAHRTTGIRDHHGRLVEIDGATIWDSRCNELKRYETALSESYWARKNATSIADEGIRTEKIEKEKVQTYVDMAVQTEASDDDADDSDHRVPPNSSCDSSVVMVDYGSEPGQQEDALTSQMSDLGFTVNDIVESCLTNSKSSPCLHITNHDSSETYGNNVNGVEVASSNGATDGSSHNDDNNTASDHSSSLSCFPGMIKCSQSSQIPFPDCLITDLQNKITLLTQERKRLGQQPVYLRSPFPWNTCPYPDLDDPRSIYQSRPSRVLPRTLVSQAPLIEAGLYGHNPEALARQCWTENHEWWEWMQTWKRSVIKRELNDLRGKKKEWEQFRDTWNMKEERNVGGSIL